IIEKAPHEIKKKIIVINTSYPGILKAPNDFQAVFSINTPNHLVGRWVGDFLIKSDLRKERIPATEPHSNFEVQKKVRQKESQSRSNSLTGNSSS
ncbi:MAG: hypothetical protein KDD61_00450, partial [Bdellovibrionales bacterium]|nr:hypothetical protein [Bdellovibrionales bacterium]